MVRLWFCFWHALISLSWFWLTSAENSVIMTYIEIERKTMTFLMFLQSAEIVSVWITKKFNVSWQKTTSNDVIVCSKWTQHFIIVISRVYVLSSTECILKKVKATRRTDQVLKSIDAKKVVCWWNVFLLSKGLAKIRRCSICKEDLA